MKYYIIAGEASGDLHGSNLIKALQALDPKADIRCWGGDMMQQTGAVLVKHFKDLAFMGFIEVVKNLRTIFRNLSFCKKDIEAFAPDVVVLIDYPGFNLRIAKWAKKQGLKVVYYIAPQVWAWKESRVPAMKKCIDKMLVILPFEKQYFKEKWQWDVDYVGHPLVEVVGDFKKNHPEIHPEDQVPPIVALVPGSRKQEILTKLPIMLGVAKYFPQYQFVVSRAPAQDESLYVALMENVPNVLLASESTYSLMMRAKAALVTSGTATLETALFETPEVVCYKGSNVSYQIAKRLIKIKYISLVNLIMDRLVVKELIQNDLTVENCTVELTKILDNPTVMLQDYKALIQKLSGNGHASMNAASIIYDFTK